MAAQNAIITVIDIIASNSGGHNNIHSGQIGVLADQYNSEYLNLNASQTKDIGAVNTYLFIESTDPITVTVTKAGGSSLVIQVATLLLLTDAFTDVSITNTGATQVGIKIISG
jgi:hypothetical protein